VTTGLATSTTPPTRRAGATSLGRWAARRQSREKD
jgi:hypothetical protein